MNRILLLRSAILIISKCKLEFNSRDEIIRTHYIDICGMQFIVFQFERVTIDASHYLSSDVHINESKVGQSDLYLRGE